MVAIGVYFTRKNQNTDDYFRGGKHIPWWAGLVFSPRCSVH